MVAMHYDGNFDAERGQLKRIDEVITNELTTLEKTIDGMNDYWRDEKSASFITSAKEFIAQLKTDKEQAISYGNNVLSSVEKALEIYEK